MRSASIAESCSDRDATNAWNTDATTTRRSKSQPPSQTRSFVQSVSKMRLIPCKMGRQTPGLFNIILVIYLLCISFSQAKIESEAAHSAEENVKDEGGLLDEEYAEINFADDPEEEEADESFLPENMLSVVFTTKEKCFFEEVLAGSVLRGAWFITSSDPTPIYTKVKKIGKVEEVMYEHTEDKDAGGFTVNVDSDGTYAYCFQHTEFPTSTELVLTFAVDVSTPSKPKDSGSAVKPEHIYPLQRSTTNMYHTLQSLVSELEVILLRIDRHVQTQDSTELRVWLLTSLETFAIAGITAFQIYFVRRLVNKSRQWV